MKRNVLIIGGILAAAAGLALTIPAMESGETTHSETDPEAFTKYWYAGEAEITSYHLQQARYGEMRDGEAVLVFVTEPFNPKKQVKSDSGGGVNVLKCNFTRNFTTGIYPYSMMTSSFLPLEGDDAFPVKITTSSQEWCGHTFTQLNRKEDGYRLRQFSYFESEGDIDRNIQGSALPEDALWTMIRKNPQGIPTGETEVIPGTQFLRLSHLEVKPYRAKIERVQKAGQEEGIELEYLDINRKLVISYTPVFPYEIQRWEETYSSGWGSGAKEMVTTARLNKRIKSDYWNQNSNADSELRKELGLN